MKKVRYAIGALGAAPALGLMIPAANATTSMTQTSASTGKTVSLMHANIPLVNCGHNHTKYARDGLLDGGIGYSGTTCVHSQWAELSKFQTGLTERVRYYSGKGTLERTTWQAGKDIDNQYTWFSSLPNSYAHEVCEALVANGNHNDVKYGPICETT